jgi:hypothetical protein
MALTDTFVKKAKHSGKPGGDKYADGGGMYLLVTAGGRYWRMDYRLAAKRKTLAFGVYPAVSPAKARKRREAAREPLADGIDPRAAKRQEKRATVAASANSFEAVAHEFFAAKAMGWSPKYAARWIERMEKDLFPFLGALPLASITAPVLLEGLRRVEKRGARRDGAHVASVCRAGVSLRHSDRAIRAQSGR